MKVRNQTEKAAATLGAQARKLLAARRNADRTARSPHVLPIDNVHAEQAINHYQDSLGKAMHRAGVDAIEVDGVRIVKVSPSQAVPLRATAQGYVQQINRLLDDDDYIDTGEAIDLLVRIRGWLAA